MVADIPPSGSSFPSLLAVAGSTLFFFADDGTHGREPWTYTPGGGPPAMVKDIVPNAGALAAISQGTAVGSLYFFVADDGVNGYELWVSDGTSGGTGLVKNINAAGNALPQMLVAVGSTLFFRADDGING